MESEGLAHSEASLDTRLTLSDHVNPAYALSILTVPGVQTLQYHAQQGPCLYCEEASRSWDMIWVCTAPPLR
jgi:hypothetical protein